MKILIRISYDGSNYYGWQRQNDFISVQQKVEEALSSLMKQNISIRGSSRTDTGVHALAQGAVFEADTTIPMEKLPYALNSFLPEDIVVWKAMEVSENFHPQYSVIDKTYEYKIQNADFRNPKLYNYTDFIHYNLDIDKMKEACNYFIGEYDFAAFCASGAQSKTTVRKIYSLSVDKNKDIITIRVKGNGFLYNMVRIIVGTLCDVGRGKIKPCEIKDIILSKNRAKAGKTMSPKGLTLVEVNYEYE
ncbi:MAG: tRNA pseudouridine(38-40) synthase TruA [Lachnospirales bacterium]